MSDVSIVSLTIVTISITRSELVLLAHSFYLCMNTCDKFALAFGARGDQKACRNYNIRVVFSSGPTFQSMLTKVKDPLPTEKYM